MDEGLTRDLLIEANAREYGPLFNYINWVDAAGAAAAQAERDRLLRTPGLAVSCLGTKIHHGPLSPGCRQCAARAWSCLFVSGRCNGRCFYCPTPQNQDDPPMSASLPFHRPEDYAAYVRFFGFGGASVSGGEPFLDFEKSLAFVTALRQTCGPDLHIWLYTNGLLATRDKLARLAAAGLDEIRFDIGATDYSLDYVRRAQGIVPTVTVEIPAVPEERERLRALMPELTAAGVSFLNLHQLRLTPHNARHLLERDYTYAHGTKVTVLESELCALELAAHGSRQGQPLAVNYCSFVYKNRFQGAAARERFGRHMLDDGEELTGNGHIRSLEILDTDGAMWHPVPSGALDELTPDSRLRVAYAATFPRHAANPAFAHRAVRIAPNFGIFLERHPVQGFKDTNPGDLLRDMTGKDDADLPGSSLEESFERIGSGLGLYF